MCDWTHQNHSLAPVRFTRTNEEILRQFMEELARSSDLADVIFRDHMMYRQREIVGGKFPPLIL